MQNLMIDAQHFRKQLRMGMRQWCGFFWKRGLTLTRKITEDQQHLPRQLRMGMKRWCGCFWRRRPMSM
jgi:hypothetical protein